MRNQEVLGSYRRGSSKPPVLSALLKGLVVAVVITLVAVVLFALAMRALKPGDTLVSAVNQIIKLGAIFAGVWVCVGRGGQNGASRGGMVGLLYMALGVGLYALLSGQQLTLLGLLADLGMGVAAGGLCGMIFSNLSEKRS